MRRYIKSYVITAGAMMVPLVAERLFLYPLVERSLVEEGHKQGFGLWTWFYGVLLMIGLAIGQGGNYVVLRHYSTLDSQGKKKVLQSSDKRFFLFALPLICVTSIVLCYTIEVELLRSSWALLASGFVWAVYQTYSLTLTAVLRARQRLMAYFLLNAAPAVFLILACVFYLYFWPAQKNVSIFLLMVVVAMSAVGLFVYYKNRVEKTFEAVGEEKVIKLGSGEVVSLNKDANYASLISLGDHGVAYFPRMILGVEGLLRESGVFVAALGLATLFLTPVVLLGSSIMTVISGDKSNTLNGKRFWSYLAFVLLCSIVVAAATMFGLPFVASYLYPTMTSDIEILSPALSLSGLALVFVYLFRPHVMKWLPMENVVRISILIAAVVLVTSFLAVRFYFLQGAIWAYAAASVALALVWSTFWFRVRRSNFS